MIRKREEKRKKEEGRKERSYLSRVLAKRKKIMLELFS
jgi:hypothetical protein